MKISLNWAQQYSNVPLNKIGTDKLVIKIGAQLGAVEEIEAWGPRFDGILVVSVVKCEQHPNADKLKVCLIDDGGKAKGVKRDSNKLVQVVCGAPNVREGLLVAWLPPGSTVPSSIGKEPFVLEPRELRGVVSNGMLASASELGISDDHSGLLEIDPIEVGKDLAKPGTPFKQLYGLDDVVIDVENKMFTHRPDCFGVLGVARELAGIQRLAYKSPSWYIEPGKIKSQPTELKLNVKNSIPKLVPRFMAQVVEDIEVGISSVRLQAGLARVGIRPINSVVDWSNYFMYTTAQPTHAFDYDKIKALSNNPSLFPRMAEEGEQLKLLNGKTIKLSKSDMVIATDKQAVALAGVMGGSETEVDENTKTIIIECATFDMYTIRRTAMRHGLFTDAVTRYNKGQSPHQNDRVLAQMVHQLEQAGAKPTLYFDVQSNLHVPSTIRTTPSFINERLGLKLSPAQITKLLENVEFRVQTAAGKQLAITPPFWRTDIEIAEDIVEEVGRLYGYDHLPLELPKRSLQPTAPDSLIQFKQKLREGLALAGANEVLTYSFVHGNLFEKVGQDSKHAFKLVNALSPDLQYYRISLMPSLLDKVHMNIKAGFGQFALFEINKVHYKGEWDADDPKVPNEDTHVALVVAYDDKRQPAGAPYYQALKYLAQIAPRLTEQMVRLSDFDVTTDEWGQQLTAPYEPNRSAVVVKDGKIWGVVGEFRASVRRTLKLPHSTAGFEIHSDVLKGIRQQSYQPIPRYPKVEQDISLKVNADVSYAELHQLLANELLGKPEHAAQLDALDIYQRDHDQAHKQISFRFTVAHYEKTMKSEEVNAMLDAAAEVARNKLGAERL